jgi:hypothetical protein
LRPRGFIFGIEMAFTGGAADHQGSHFEEARKNAPDGGRDFLDFLARPSQEILIVDEKRLDRPYLAGFIFDREIAILEALIDRILDNFEIAMVFTLGR